MTFPVSECLYRRQQSVSDALTVKTDNLANSQTSYATCRMPVEKLTFNI
ncbi:MAG: hypothetical protein LBH80_02320 [Prevotellaceae bacterium]|jgi:hypothetical protein|nr:hypothetical protein [Prevotellaceae bacterium]